MTPRGDQRSRLLTAVAICDGHDSAIMTVNQELVRAGAEVVYLGYHRSAAEIARAAVQEDVRAAGISSYNGGHVEFFCAVRTELEARGRPDLPLFGGGGATITRADATALRRCGVERIYHAGTPLERITSDLLARYRPGPVERPSFGADDASLGRWLTLAEAGALAAETYRSELRQVGERRLRGESEDHARARVSRRLLAEASAFEALFQGLPAHPRKPPVIGFAGPGGAGKSTLIDELVLRFLRDCPGRVAVLSNDPDVPGREDGPPPAPPPPGRQPAGGRVAKGALLADRATMIASQDDRVFQRSFATRGAADVSPALPNALRVLLAADFALILIESAGTGQESLPFPAGSVDETVLVMTPEYGARLQLEKLALLSVADIIVLNKADRPTAPAALREVRGRHGRAGSLHATVASRHRDPGVEALWAALGKREPRLMEGSLDGTPG